MYESMTTANSNVDCSREKTMEKNEQQASQAHQDQTDESHRLSPSTLRRMQKGREKYARSFDSFAALGLEFGIASPRS
jgi:hypothetical protein